MISKIKCFFIFCFCLLFINFRIYAQDASIKGNIKDDNGAISWVSIQIENTNLKCIANEEGNFSFDSLQSGLYTIQFHSLGYKDFKTEVFLEKSESKILEIKLTEDRLNLNEVVISGTRYELDKRVSPVAVNVLKPRMLEATQSMAISEGLSFQPGVRVETNCQNCGFTQVRLNGLDGAYSQILINNRAVFSALNGVYGLDQIPTNIVERIEIVRGGGSALYGSNAIAGTINIITREPLFNAWRIGNNLSLIDGEKMDNTTYFNSSIVKEDLNGGITVYGMHRSREAYDANKDGFTEITELGTNAIGTKAFFKPSDNSKLNLDLSYINEKRRGGDRLNLSPHFTDITERLEHNTLFYGLTYDLFFDKHKSHKFSTYVSGQVTERKSYYGGLGGGRTKADSILALNAYGNTEDLANVTGIQYSYNFNNSNVLVIGSEYQFNKVKDEIPGYNRLVDQEVNTLGLYSQFEWKIIPRLKLLNGLRYDITDVNGRYEIGSIKRTSNKNLGVLSPRITALYDMLPQVQFRAGYARGFRAPQAFNEDLHISSVGGEARFVILSENLDKELSDSYTASLSYSSIESKVQSNFVLEGFYTILKNPFTIVNTGQQLDNGSIVEELTNGNEALVQGINLEANFSPLKQLRFENGFTFQNANYRSSQIVYEPDLANTDEQKISTKTFLRNPNFYGYTAINWRPIEVFSTDISSTYTGQMLVPKIVSSNGQVEIKESEPFIDTNLKFSYHIDFKNDLKLEFSVGVQNMFNSYQDDFDRGPQRDSDYIYGPARPRTFFFGINLGNYH